LKENPSSVVLKGNYFINHLNPNFMNNYAKVVGITFMSIVFLSSCSKNGNDLNGMDGEAYQTTFKITDAPVDDANVEAVFVTIAHVKVDGQNLEGFNATTLNLSALSNGKTATLGNLDLQAGTYSNIELELDYDTDANGNAPGCYVMTVDGAKDKLSANANTILINDSYDVLAQASNEIVLDFDLRKTIKKEQDALSSNFEFVSATELAAGIRTVNESVTGRITGTASDTNSTSDKIVVYAYEKGTFDETTETRGQGESNVLFAHAVTSSVVSDANNSYHLSFLKEGEYELVFVSYNQDGDQFYFNALLEAESTLGLNLGALQVTSALQLSADVTITGTK
jgi:hypothetical protein